MAILGLIRHILDDGAVEAAIMRLGQVLSDALAQGGGVRQFQPRRLERLQRRDIAR